MLVLCLLKQPVHKYIGPMSIGTPCVNMLILYLMKHPVCRNVGPMSIGTPSIKIYWTQSFSFWKPCLSLIKVCVEVSEMKSIFSNQHQT